MSGCFNVNVTGMTGVGEFVPTTGVFPADSYSNYYHPYYNRQHPSTAAVAVNIDGLSPLDFDSKQDMPTYEDYVTPEVASYGMPPSLLHSSSPYFDDKFRAADGGQRLSYVSVMASPSDRSADQFSAFTEPYLSSAAISSANQNAADRASRLSETMPAHSAVIDFLPAGGNQMTPDGCDTTIGNDSSAVGHLSVTSQTSNSFTVQLANVASCNINNVGNLRTRISDNDLTGIGKATSNGKYNYYI